MPTSISRNAVRIGVALKRVRSVKGWTLTELADAVGVAKSTLSKYENGLIEADADRITKIEEALGSAPGTIAVLSGTASEDTIWMLLRNTDPAGYDHLNALAERMVLASEPA